MTEVPQAHEVDAIVAARPPRRAQAAVSMRIAGHSYDDIAFALGFKDTTSARVAIEKTLAAGAEPWEREQHRELQSRRYEALLVKVMPVAMDPSADEFLPAQRQAKDLIDRLVALHGAAMAQEILVKSPAAKELAAFVAAVTVGSTPDVKEIDPFGDDTPQIEGAIGQPVDAEWTDG